MDVGTLTVTMGANTAGLARAQQAMINLQNQTLKSVNAINASLNTLSAQMTKVAVKSKVAGQAIVAIEKPAVNSLNKVATNISSISQKFRTFGYLASAMVTLPMVMAGKSAMNLAMDFEFILKKMVGLAGVAKSSLGQISKEIKDLSANTGIAAQNVAEAYYYVASSGIKGADVFKVTEMAAKGAASGMGEVNDLSKLLTSALNAYAAEGLNVATMMDTLTATIRVGKAEPAEMTTALGTILPIAEKLGLTIQDVGGALATMTLITNSTATSATYLRNVLMKLLDPAPQVREAMKSMGISMEQIHLLLKTPDGFIKTMELLGKTTEKYGVTMDALFPEMRSLLGALNFTGAGLQRLKENTDEVNKSTGAFQVHFAEMSTTMKMRWNKALVAGKSAMTDFGVVVAMGVIPLLEKLVQKLENLTKWFNSLTEAQQQNWLKWAAFIAIMGPASLLLSFIGYVIAGLISAVNGLAFAFSVLNKVVLANPWVAAVTGIVLAGGWLLNYHKKMRDASEAQDQFNTSVVNVTGSIKKLKDLTNIDFKAMSLTEALAVQKEANVQYMAAKKNIKDIQDRVASGEQGKAGVSRYIDLQTEEAIRAKKIYEEAGKAIDAWAENMAKGTNVSNVLGGSVSGVTDEMRKQKEAMEELALAWAKIGNAIMFAVLAGKNWAMTGPLKENWLRKIPDMLTRNKVTGGFNIPKPLSLPAAKPNLYPIQKTIGNYKQISNITGAFSEQGTILDALGKKLDYITIKEDSLGGSMKRRRDLYNEITAKISAYSTALEALLGQQEIEGKNDRVTAENIKMVTDALEGLQLEYDNLQRLRDIFTSIGQAASSMASVIGTSLVDSSGAWQNMALVILQAGQQIVSSLMEQYIATLLLASASLAQKEVARKGLVGVITAAVGIAALIAMVSASKSKIESSAKMAEGGIIPAGYPNDSYPARLTSGEMVVPPGKLNSSMFSFETDDKLIAVVTGDQLNFILTKRKRKINSYR